MSYPGSKAQAGVFHRIIGQLPPHSCYVEPFAGSAQVFWRKRRAERSILIDRNRACIAKLGAAGPDVNAIHGDALKCLPLLIETVPIDTVIYCDPPYLLSTRAGRRYYEHELSDAQHAELLSLLCDATCRVLVSGYPSELYGAALRDWRCIRYHTRTRGRTVTECLWCNYPEPDELHDWRYCGRNYRERLYLKRLAKRWLAKLDAMPKRKRGFVLDAIAQRQAQREDPQNCPKCGYPATYIRDRGFEDGSGKVWMCDHPGCDAYRLYFYPYRATQARAPAPDLGLRSVAPALTIAAAVAGRPVNGRVYAVSAAL